MERTDFTQLQLPSEIHFNRDQFDEWYATIAFTHPRTVKRMAQGLMNWTKEEAFTWYDEELTSLEKIYKETYKQYMRWKIVASFSAESMQRFLEKKPGPLPPHKTRVYHDNDYLEKYSEEKHLQPPYQNAPPLMLGRTLSHVQDALMDAMEKADECREGDTILNNYFIPYNPWSPEKIVTYSVLMKIDGKMKLFERHCKKTQFDPTSFTFDTSNYHENEQFFNDVSDSIKQSAVQV
jgi:hypothetical protein